MNPADDHPRAPIFTDTYTLCEWLLKHLNGQTDSLARHLCDNALSLLEQITLAIRNHDREERLDLADERLIMLRMQLRLAVDVDLLSERRGLHALGLADSIGRQLGGWQRSLHPA